MSSLLDYLQKDPECKDLASGAVLVVAPLLEDPDPCKLLAVLDDWAFQLAGRMPLPWNIHSAIDALNHFLFHEQGLSGDRETFDDPANAVLPRVLERKKGLPVSLSILWIECAKRLGMDAVGVGLPGHFITGLNLEVGSLYFDPFRAGKAIDEEDATRIVLKGSKGHVNFQPSMLDPMPNRAILARLVRNLHNRYVRSFAWNDAFWTSTHLVLLHPEDPAPYRERAFVHLKRGCVMEALQDLQDALRLGSDEDPRLAEWVERLKKG